VSTICTSVTQICIVSDRIVEKVTLLHDGRTLVLALSRRNTNAAEIILFLHRLSQVLVEYFKELEEESIRDNFVIIYELLDEMMDFGYPQTTESKILQESVLPALRQLIARKPYTLTPSGTSLKSLTSWRFKFGLQWLSQMLFLGVPRGSGTAKMRCSWMSLKA
jgi:hypothetical protein